mmetsp:Transcript_13778/g.55129  ORF Transcript_13778/g.55129 Transcript_13778/m.55129 type:complete len:245 (+) Transcript_13778:1570-2304(+)
MMPASSKTPRSTRRKPSMTAPSSTSVVESAGIDPGVDPPTSAWWPREAQKKRGVRAPVSSSAAASSGESSEKTGVTTVMSGRCEPPALGSFATTTSPGRSAPSNLRRIARTVSAIAPRCTGTCGALATSPPSAAKMAQLKSSRSLMLTEEAVRCSVRPICSAIDMNRWLNTPSRAGSTAPTTAAAAGPSSSFDTTNRGGTSMTRSPSAVSVAVVPGSSTHVDVPTAITAGPAICWCATVSDALS